MPFTAFHLGAGLLGKGIAPQSQSLTFFMACQVAIDLEPGIKMLAGSTADLHTITHSPLGLAATVTACGLLWHFAQRATLWKRTYLPLLGKRALIDTAVWSALTHLVLDAISHRDMVGSIVFFAGIDYAEDAALLMGAIGITLLGVRWGIGAIGASSPSAKKPAANKKPD